MTGFTVHQQNRNVLERSQGTANCNVEQRRLPYPFRAMLAICSDLDETPDRHVYLESARFLNTSATTAMGQGVGLEVGNTIYFDMPAGQFAYWNTDDAGREMIRELIRSGHVDCLHSFGDLATTRAHAARALDDLVRHDCRIDVWIDHATAPTNFGSDIMRGTGDLPGSAAYHADLTCDFGVQYVWRGRVTSVIGQGVRRSLSGIFNPHHSLPAALTTAKELAKGLLARSGNVKYRPHAENAVTYAAQLRDGRSVTEFLRANPHYSGVSGGDTAGGIPEVLTDGFLDRLIGREGFCILYTHLGKVADAREPFCADTRKAFRRLAVRQASGDILVTTTRRLLGYVEACRRARPSIEPGATTTVRLDFRDSKDRTSTAVPPDLDGLTFYAAQPQAVRIVVNGRDVTSILQHNPPDQTGRTSVSLPWRRLTFPAI